MLSTTKLEYITVTKASKESEQMMEEESEYGDKLMLKFIWFTYGTKGG